MVRSGDKSGVMVKFPMSDGEIRCWKLKVAMSDDDLV